MACPTHHPGKDHDPHIQQVAPHTPMLLSIVRLLNFRVASRVHVHAWLPAAAPETGERCRGSNFCRRDGCGRASGSAPASAASGSLLCHLPLPWPFRVLFGGSAWELSDLLRCRFQAVCTQLTMSCVTRSAHLPPHHRAVALNAAAQMYQQHTTVNFSGQGCKHPIVPGTGHHLNGRCLTRILFNPL